MGSQEGKVSRRLAAIFAADVAAYSRHMEQDEAGTIQSLTAHREVMDRLIAEHGGRIANTAGDSVLAEFPSAVDAVRCAIQVQEALAAANLDNPEERQLQFRIGLHVGDVMRRDGDLLGDGVNIASRLESIAEPGGICLSEVTYGHVRKNLPLTYSDLGPQRVKNMEEPIRAYALKASLFARVGVEPTKPPPLPERPSIAVLPFTNMSGDPEQEYFADGMAEDIITGLARLKWLFVIARNSTFTYKGKAVNVRQVARDLGVRYVLEGSVRASGRRIRITGQLIDAETGKHIWAEKYDRQLDDIFAVQDEITESVVAAIEPHIYAEEGFRAQSKPPESLDAWGYVIRALSLVFRVSRSGNAEAQRLAREAILLDPSYARAYAVLAWAVMWQGHCFWSEDAQASYSEALQYAEKSISLDTSEPWGRTTLCHILSARGQHEQALHEAGVALRLNPNFALAHTIYGWALLRSGRFEEAVAETGKALRISPNDDFAGFYSAIHGLTLLGAQRFEEALPHIRRSVSSMPEFFGNWRTLASCCGHLGLMDEARAAVARAETIRPGITLAMARKHLWGYAHRDIFVEGLRKAGVPE